MRLREFPMRCKLQELSLIAVVGALLACGARRLPSHQEPPPNDPHAIVKLRVVYHASSGPSLNQSARIDNARIDFPRPAPIGTGAVRAMRIQAAATWVSFSADFNHPETHRVGDKWYTDYVTDAACGAGTWVPARAGATYLVQFDYFGHRSCSMTCKLQVPLPGGDSRFEGCEGREGAR